jgi:tryptophanyl-tRNA synthetase
MDHDPTARKVSLTGIKPTGLPHLGNLIGAISPAITLADTYDAMYFVADYHAITDLRNPEQLRHYTRSVAATWIAAGLDTSRATMYRQSDVPETFELAWLLSCVTAKGLMNRAHAYKAAKDKNAQAGRDDDFGVNMGLYNYPVLMAADILLMGSDVVPVGKDQSQHVEYAADIANSFNHLYGEHGYKLKVPEPVLPADDSGKVLPGTDGRKMSKSYGNTIPLFTPASDLHRLINRIPTDSTPVEDPKDPDSSSVFQILEQFAPADVAADIRKRLVAGGMGWGDLKQALFEALNARLGPLRERYEELMAPGSELDAILASGAERARARARVVLDGARAAVGID